MLSATRCPQLIPQGARIWLWIHAVDYAPQTRDKKFLPHMRWNPFSQLHNASARLSPADPQRFPQAAHNFSGVSAHVLHSTIHRWCWHPAWRAGKMSEPSARTVEGSMMGEVGL